MTEKILKETKGFSCKACGAEMIFEADTQSLKCKYCDCTEFIEMDSEDIEEKDFFEYEENEEHDWGNDECVIKCENCGAKTVVEPHMLADNCAFCGSPQISKLDENTGIIPESLIPFKIDKKKADEIFDKWLNKKFFIPKAAKKCTDSNKLKGVYIPHWTYDTDTHSSYSAQAGHYYYVTETKWVTENGERKQVSERVRKIRWKHVSGNYNKFFDDILINASEKFNNKVLNSIEPFNFEDLVKYRAEFLSGFLAEHYTVDVKKGWEDAKTEIKAKIRSGVKSKIHADEVRFLNINTSYDDVTYKHLLLPVWISTFNFKNKVYRCMINGQTGKIGGKIPLSVPKILLAVLGIIGVLGIIALIVIKAQAL